MIYAISDIHGCYHTFQNLLKSINFSNNDMLFCLGDTIDRGEHNLKLLDLFMTNDNMKLIKGNHEFFYECWVHGWLSPNDWNRFGGNTTLAELKEISKDKILEYFEFIRTLPLYIETDNFILAHNGFNARFPFVKNNDGEIKVKDTIEKQWAYDPYNFIISGDIHRTLPKIMPNMKLDKKMIIGHVPTPFLGSEKVYKTPNYLAIDGGATYKSGRLTCLRLDDLAEFYEDIDSRDIGGN